jgi:hypothetical protein
LLRQRKTQPKAIISRVRPARARFNGCKPRRSWSGKVALRVAPAHEVALNICSCDTAVTLASAAITDDIDWNILAQSNFFGDFLNRGATIERLLADCPYCRYASLVGTGLASGND